MNKLKSIQISNYKCFKRVSFNLQDTSILIGENNAGKSTAIEAIRLLACGIDKLKMGGLIECPYEVSERKIDRCVKLNIEALLIDISACSYKFNEKPSYITGYFENKSFVKIVVLNKVVYAIAYDNNKKCCNTKNLIINCDFPNIFVMPHFNLLKELEKSIDDRRTKRDRYNYRSSWHFRNELLNYKEDIAKLNLLLEQTWKNIAISVSYKPIEDTYITVMVRSVDFTTEIKDYGSGFQMWIQILWFLCKVKDYNSLVILDEPDVYIHADLQRKLFRLVADNYSQMIVATHSIEIINEANISDIMIVDKNQSSFSFCKSKEKLGFALKSIGTAQNIMLTKLQRHNKCLFVEGDDLNLLDGFFKIATNDQSKSIKDYATSRLGGKDHYKEIFGAAKIFNDDTNGTFQTFCLLDKDYNETYNQQIIEDAQKNNIILHILNKIEIENYLIVPRVISKIVGIDENVVEAKIKELADTLKGSTFDRILQVKISEYRKIQPAKDIASISKETREYIDSQWDNLNNILNIVPGKELKALIFQWMKSDYNIACCDKKIISLMNKDDLPVEFVDFLLQISK